MDLIEKIATEKCVYKMLFISPHSQFMFPNQIPEEIEFMGADITKNEAWNNVLN